MKKLGFLVVLAVLLSSCSHQLLNLTQAKKEVQHYYESGQFDREMGEVVAAAIKNLENVKFDEKSAAVLDVDEASLNNYPAVKAVDFGYEKKSWDEWIYSAKAKAFPQTKKLYDFLVGKGVKIFFITGRNARYYDATIKNLIDAGYTKFDSLICRGEKDAKTTAVQYKSAQRVLLVNKGFKIIANVGDQWSDSEGGNSGFIIKLPNYLYFVD